MTLSDSTPTYSMMSISPVSFSVFANERDSGRASLTVVRPGVAAQGPKGGPDATLVWRHVNQVEDEQAVRPAPDAGQPDAEAAQGRIWIQNLGRVGPPFGRVLGNIDHAVRLRGCLVDIVDEAVSGITGRPEVEVVEEGGPGEVAVEAVGRLSGGDRGEEKEQDAAQKVHRAGLARPDRSKRCDCGRKERVNDRGAITAETGDEALLELRSWNNTNRR